MLLIWYLKAIGAPVVEANVNAVLARAAALDGVDATEAFGVTNVLIVVRVPLVPR